MGDLTSYYNDPNLQKAAGEAETAGTQAAAYLSAASLLPQKLREAIQEKLDYNRDLIEQKNKAMSEYFQAPSAARAKYGSPESSQYIFNPMQQEALVAKEKAMAYQPYANLVDILGERKGTLADILQAGTQAFQADVTAKQTASELAQQKYKDLLELAQLKADAAYKAESLKKGSSSGFEDMYLEAKRLGLLDDTTNTQANEPQEPMPNYSPASGKGTLSPRGEWIYTGNGPLGWEPSGFVSETGGEISNTVTGGKKPSLEEIPW